MELTGVIALAGVSAGILASALLFTLPFGMRRANRLLGLFVAALTLFLLQRWFSFSGVLYSMPHLQGISLWMNFALGPLLYFYIRVLTEKDFSFRRGQLAHGLAVVLALLCYLPGYFQPAAVKLEFIATYLPAATMPERQPLSAGAEYLLLSNVVGYFLFVVHFCFYCVLCLLQLNAHARKLCDTFSSTEQITLDWLRRLTWLTLFISLLLIFYMIGTYLRPGTALGEAQFLTTCMMAMLVYFVGFMGVRQPAIYQGSPQSMQGEGEPGPDALPGAQKSKYERSGLSEDGQRATWLALRELMESDKPYLRNGLTIGQLSETMGLPVAYISQTINAEAGMNFFDFINSYRISEAERLLREQGDDIALSTFFYDVGFNSKSSFYTQFKKHMNNQTPRQFLASLDG